MHHGNQLRRPPPHRVFDGRGIEYRAPLRLDGVDLGASAASDLAEQVAEAAEDRRTSTRSPGEITDVRIVSMPARAVPSTRNVQ